MIIQMDPTRHTGCIVRVFDLILFTGTCLKNYLENANPPIPDISLKMVSL